MAKGCSDIQIYYLEEIIAFLALFYQKWIWVMLQGSASFCLNNHEIHVCSKIYQLTGLHVQGLF